MARSAPGCRHVVRCHTESTLSTVAQNVRYTPLLFDDSLKLEGETDSLRVVRERRAVNHVVSSHAHYLRPFTPCLGDVLLHAIKPQDVGLRALTRGGLSYQPDVRARV